MITLNVNGKVYQANAAPDTPMLWVLRDIFGLTGTKYGCGIEVCGACTILLDGEAQKCCEMNVSEGVGRLIETVEGLSPNQSHPLQKAWLQIDVPQCGNGESVQIMAAVALNHQGEST